MYLNAKLKALPTTIGSYFFSYPFFTLCVSLLSIQKEITWYHKLNPLFWLKWSLDTVRDMAQTARETIVTCVTVICQYLLLIIIVMVIATFIGVLIVAVFYQQSVNCNNQIVSLNGTWRQEVNFLQQQLDAEKDSRQKDTDTLTGKLTQLQEDYNQCLLKTAVDKPSSIVRYPIGMFVLEVNMEKWPNFSQLQLPGIITYLLEKYSSET